MDKKTIWDLDRDSVEVFRSKPKMPLVVVLDNIRSLNNIGSIFRTSDAFLVERIMLCGITACPPSPEIHKTALGAEDSVRWEYYTTTEACIAALKSEGYEICALEQVKGSVLLQDFKVDVNKNYALIAGHEVHGVSQSAVDSADVCIEIPQFGTKHSLNVSVSVALGIWHFFRSRLGCS
ncbi:MAG: RNA methyltransferase [Paramuribaculum sp.]|nr:RNA methyltransferase [Paramuribaculum sp.]